MTDTKTSPAKRNCDGQPSLAPATCSVERTPRSVIEKKLLTALGDESCVAILATKQDLEDMIAALCGYELGTWKGNVLSWEDYRKRCRSLSNDMTQLLHEAFPPNKHI